MKRIQNIKEEVFRQLQASGQFKNVQGQLKSEVYNIIQKSTNTNKKTLGFQYEHPLLSKLRKFPLTSLCMDLIQEFLQSFKFKYTLDVFKKQINRNVNINRTSLSDQFKIQMSNPEKQAVLLSLVSQLVSGDIKINLNNGNNQTNNAFVQLQNKNVQNPRMNNFVSTQTKKTQSQSSTGGFNKKNNQNSFNSSNQQKSKLTSQLDSSQSKNTTSNISIPQKSSNQSSSQIKSNTQSSIKPSQSLIKQEEAKIQKGKKDKKKKVQQKPPEGATDLLGDVMGKFKTKDAKAQEVQKNKIFQEKRAFSQEKVKKVVDPSQSGANKIRGVSMGKMSSFMSKFYNPPTTKNQSFIQQQLDQFQQSKDSTRKNPLFSSSQSGFQNSKLFYDQSVDSNAIQDYEYVERAKKFGKKF